MDKKETQKQKQKQKQTVIVNIGDKVVRRKRKRRPRKKSSVPPPPPPSPFPPPQHDFAKVIFQAQPTPLRAEENLALQLNSVTQQLQTLQDKQDHATANLMASLMAQNRDEQARAEAARAAEEAASKEAEEALILQQLAQRVEKQEEKAKKGKQSGSPQTAEPFKGGDFKTPVADARVIDEPTFPQQPILGGGMVADPQPRQKKQIVSRSASARASAAAEEPAPSLKRGPGRPKGSVSKPQLKDPPAFPDITSFFEK